MRADPKWKQKELSERFISGVHGGEFTSAIDFWRKVLKPAGCPPQRYRYLRDKGNWDTEARLLIGQKELLHAQDRAATEYEKLEGSYAKASALANALQDDIARIRSKADLTAADIDKLMNAAHKSQQIAALALDRPTSRDGNGAVAVQISFSDEQAPYARAVIGEDKPVVIAVDETSNATPRELPSSERGEENTENGPVLQVAPVQGPDESLSGGGVVHSPVQESGEDGSVETVNPVADGSTPEVDSGKDQ